MDKEGFEQFVRAFQGLTISTVKTILSKALARSGKITLNDLQLVLEEKKQVIRKTQVLEFFNAEETMGSIGGMDVLKSWIITRGMAFSEQAQQFGLPYPKGVLIVGIQGTGKSLCAKAISQQWHMPLLRLDVGRLMGSYVGESEARTREMIQIAEAMAPCVLWIDEVDKGFAGIGKTSKEEAAKKAAEEEVTDLTAEEPVEELPEENAAPAAEPAAEKAEAPAEEKPETAPVQEETAPAPEAPAAEAAPEAAEAAPAEETTV